MSATNNNIHEEKNNHKSNKNVLIINESEDAFEVEPPPNLNKNIKYRIHRRQNL
ncbi:MAG: hypothetical protein ACP6IU_01180 [Candidatus Asgardarchaeia archaeon]